MDQYGDWLRAKTRRIGTKHSNPKAGIETSKESNKGVTENVPLQKNEKEVSKGEQISCTSLEIDGGEGNESAMEKAKEV